MKKQTRKKNNPNIFSHLKNLGTGVLSGAATGFGLGYYSTQAAGANKTPSKRIVDSAKKGHYGILAGKSYAKKAQQLANTPGSAFYDPISSNSLITTIAQRRGALLGGVGGLGYTGYQLYKNRSKKKKI
jgi:hypothetical protein